MEYKGIEPYPQKADNFAIVYGIVFRLTSGGYPDATIVPHMVDHTRLELASPELKVRCINHYANDL